MTSEELWRFLDTILFHELHTDMLREVPALVSKAGIVFSRCFLKGLPRRVLDSIGELHRTDPGIP